MNYTNTSADPLTTIKQYHCAVCGLGEKDLLPSQKVREAGSGFGQEKIGGQ